MSIMMVESTVVLLVILGTWFLSEPLDTPHKYFCSTMQEEHAIIQSYLTTNGDKNLLDIKCRRDYER